MALRRFRITILWAISLALAACGPRAAIPPRPLVVPGAVADTHPLGALAVTLAPVLYLHPDEWFPIERVVAVVHPTRPLIAYHVLWQDDIYGSWIPWTVPTDQEIVWVEHDGSGNPTALWSYWHRAALKAEWPAGEQPAFDVQWGKHGSIPRGTVLADLPDLRTMPAYYLFSWLGVVDAVLGRLTRPGPICFCRGYQRFTQFTDAVPLSSRLDAIVVAEDPDPALTAIFGHYSRKPPWPYLIAPYVPPRPNWWP